jgi:fatty-acyl-CoA synthase
VLALNTEFSPPQIAAALGDRDAAVLVHDEEFTEAVAASEYAGGRVIAWHENAVRSADAPSTLDELAARGLPAEDVLPSRRSRIVILTSGTTGVPKGASRDLPLRSMLGSLVTLIGALGLRRSAAVLVAPPLFHGLGLAFASIAHGVGAPVVLRRRFDPQDTLAAIAAERVHTLVAVPVMLQRLLDVPADERARHDLSSLRAAVSAGAPLAPHLSERFMDAFGDVLCNAYGSTETGFGAIATAADLRAAPGTVGRAPVGGVLHILGPDRRPVPQGTIGHVFVGGDLVFDGYTTGGTKEMAGGLMNSGDLGHVDAAGLAFIDGREDDMIVSGGENVFPQEVEDALAAHPGVADVAVLGVPDDEFGQRLLAFVAPGRDAPTTEDLVAHLRGRLERYKLPREIVMVDEIPRTATGKVLRRELSSG